jgi:hypothetical protein
MGFPTWLMKSDHSPRGIPVFEILHWGVFRAAPLELHEVIRRRRPSSWQHRSI